MGIKEFFGNIRKKIMKPIMVHKSKVQTSKTDFTDLAETIGEEFIDPGRTGSGAPITTVKLGEYDVARSTSHVKGNQLSGIYFTDVIAHTLSESMQEQYKNEYRAKYVYIPQEAMEKIISELSPDEIEELKTAGIIDKNGKMTVENYRKWQMDIIAAREKALPGNAPEKVFGDIQTGFEEHLHERSAREWARQFYEDETDKFGIAERFGGKGKGILNKFAKNANIPVPVLAVCAIMSVQDKDGKPVELVFDGEGKVTKASYKAVREALGDDPLVGFLDEFCGYEMQGTTIKNKEGNFLGVTPGIPRGVIRKVVGSMVKKDKDAFLVSPETFVTRRDLRTEATRISDRCSTWTKQAMADYRRTGAETLLDSEALNAAAIEFADGVTKNGAQNPFLTRRKEKVLQIVVTNQSTMLHDRVTDPTTGIIKKYTDMFNPDSDKKVKFTAPKAVDIKRVYASDFSVLTQNILLIDDVQSQLTLELDSISGMDFTDPTKVDRVLGNLKMTREQVTELANKYGVKDVDKMTGLQFVELAIKLRSKERVAQVVDFNSSILDLITLKEDLRVCEHVVGQFKFNSLQAADDAYKAAVAEVKQRQEDLRNKIRDEELQPAKDDLDKLTKERDELKGKNLDLQNKKKEKLQERQNILSEHIKAVQPQLTEQFNAIVARILAAEARNAKNRVPDITNKNIKGLIDNAIQAVLTEDIYDANGKIDYNKLSNIVSAHIGNIANTVHRIALGTKDKSVVVDQSVIDNYTDSFVDSVSAPLTVAVSTVGTQLAEIDSEIERIDAQLSANNTRIEELEDTLIPEQEGKIKGIEKKIEDVPDIPKDTRDLIVAEKVQRARIAETKIGEAETMITSILGFVGAHDKALADAVSGEYSIFAVNAEGQLVLKDDEALKALVGEETYTQYKAIVEAYGADSKKLTELMSGKVTQIIEIAKKDFDIVIEIGDDGRPVFDSETGKIKAVHIDNPHRVKGDIDPRVVQLYEHQSKIDRYTEIKKETDPKKRAQLIEALPPAERRAFRAHADQLDTYIDSQIEAELQASDKIRVQYNAMEGPEKVKFQQDYARVEHYETGNYIPANADEAAMAETLAPDLEKVDAKISVVSNKQKKKAEIKEDEIVEEASVDEIIEEDRVPPAYSSDVVKFVQANDKLKFIDKLQSETDPVKRIALVQEMGLKYPETKTFFDGLVTAEGELSENFNEQRTMIEEEMIEISTRQEKVGTPECQAFVDHVVAYHGQTEGEHDIPFTTDDKRKYRHEAELTIANQQELARERAAGGVSKPKKEARKEVITFVDDYEFQKLFTQIKGMTAAERLASEHASEWAEQGLIDEKGEIPKKALKLEEKSKKRVEKLSKKLGTVGIPERDAFMEEAVTEYMDRHEEDYAEMEEPDLEAERDAIIADMNETMGGKEPKLEYTEKAIKKAIKATKKAIEAYKEEIKSEDSAHNIYDDASQQERALLEKGYLDMVASTTKPSLQGLTATQIVDIISKTDSVVIAGATVKEWRDAGITDEELLKYILKETSLTAAEAGVVTARQLQSIADSKVVDGVIINESKEKVAIALYGRIARFDSGAEITDVNGRDAVLYATLNGVADQATVTANVDKMVKLFIDNGIPITAENVQKFVTEGTLTFTPEGKEPVTITSTEIQTTINEGLKKNGLEPKAPESGDGGLTA